MIVTKQSLIDWQVTHDDGSKLAWITKDNGVYLVFHYGMGGKRELYAARVGFFEAKRVAARLEALEQGKP